MKIVIDTNRYTDFARSVPEAVEQFQIAERILVPFVVLAELSAGFLVGSRAKENERLLHRFLKSSRVAVLYPDEQTADYYASIYAQLRRQGTPIPTNDIWIAALTLQLGLNLFSRDAHFDHIAQLKRV